MTALERNEQIQVNDRQRAERDDNRKEIVIILLNQIKEKYGIKQNKVLAELLLAKGCRIQANHLSNYYNRRNVPGLELFLSLCQIAGYSLEQAGRLGWGDKTVLTDCDRTQEVSENELINIFVQNRDKLSLWATKTLLGMLQDQVFSRLENNDRYLVSRKTS